MKKTFFIILASVFAFITINTLFYINTYRSQLTFQTELLSHQIRICGSTIEQNGLGFENEVNYILYSEDITQLFNDPDIKENGSKKLELFYAKYQHLINNINILDNHKNVYSLILDRRNNFISDFYESQQQIPLNDRDRLYTENGKFYFVIPVFKENAVQANIIIEIDFIRYIGIVFDQYKLENTIWQWVITKEGEIISTFGDDLIISSQELEMVSIEIMEGNEGSLVHTIQIEGEPVQTVSVFYPIRLIQKDFGILFSIKTDLFLQSIYHKTIIITIASILLLILILFINFRIIQVKSAEAYKYEISERALRKSIDHLPAGLIIINQDQTIRIINTAALDLLLLDKEKDYTGENISTVFTEDRIKEADPTYYIAYGEGSKLTITNETHESVLFKQEFSSSINNTQVRILVIFDITSFEKTKKLDSLAHFAKLDLIDKMNQEIQLPLVELRKDLDSISRTKISAEQKELLITTGRSIDLLENLINAVIDFSRIEAGEIAFEKIPFRLRNEVNLAIDPFKPHATEKNISIITKIRNDVPEKIIGDPFRLRQVISHLIEIALEHTPEGRILLSAELIDHIHDTLRIKFQVEDTGKAISSDFLDNYLNNNDMKVQLDDRDPGEVGLKLSIVKQQIELMKGHIKIESPSSISTHPDFPGTKYTFSIEVIMDSTHKKKLDFESIHDLKEIQCLILSQINDPEDTTLDPLQKIGMNIKQRIYRNDDIESIVHYIKDHISAFHLLIILDRPNYDGFKLAQSLYEENLSGQFLLVLISSNDIPDNIRRSKQYQVDYYLVQPYESRIFYEIICDHFIGIPEESLKHIPRGVKIKEHISILLAEDNLFNRIMGQALFKSLGFEIDLAKNGNEVIAMLKKKKYDIIFLDLLMPEKDGLETVAELRQKGFDMPVVALTAVETNDSRQMAYQAGINEYLVKPVTSEMLKKILLKLFSESA
ncbi:MAG: hypothetical protein AMS27_06565 [Bacteroides sp. SM23_62_1]|nr:MAG: hypothetical protein AMS27_06565 [Bacteroides sp. SM23_62_1]